ncbi:MAG: TRAP transporter substrate-binding protein [Oxalobacteraceae bacterium]|nr:TRAP transporter substrate-binding protein [Oxalobacteraceae bacterium]
MKLPTRELIVSLVLLGLAGTPLAQVVTLKVHHFLPPASTTHKNFIVPWCEKIAKESAGRLKCQIYPAMQMGGSPQQLYDQVKDGVADIVWTVPSYQAGRFPVIEAYELPFMVQDSERASRGLWHYAIRNATAEFKGVKPILFHVHDGSLMHTTKKQIKTLEDFKGLKLRAPTRQGSKMLAALGATPVPMPLPQAAEALSKGVIDGVMIPWEVVPAVKFDEVTKFHTEAAPGEPQMSNTVFLFGMNPAKYDALPLELKKIIDSNSGPDPSAWVGKVFADDALPGKKSAEARKNTIYVLPAAELKRWEAATLSVTEEWIKDMSAKGFDGKRLFDEAKAGSK